jgi:hypothetical protein
MDPIEGEVVAVQTLPTEGGPREVLITIRVLDYGKPVQPDCSDARDEKQLEDLERKYQEEATRWQKFRESLMNLGVSRRVRIILDGVEQRKW